MEHPKSTPPAARCLHQHKRTVKPQHLTADASLSRKGTQAGNQVLLLLKPWKERKELWRQESQVMDGKEFYPCKTGR